jgi:hypothetical protein
MPLQFDHERLYVDYRYYVENFSWPCAELPAGQLIYHGYWDGILSKHHELCLKSLLVTQSAPFEVWLWIPRSEFDSASAMLARFGLADRVRLKIYDTVEESAGTIYEAHVPILQTGAKSDIANWFRLLALSKYGGIYFDLDVLFLADLRSLTTVEFLSQWSTQHYANNAILHFRKDSQNIADLMRRSISLGSARSPLLLKFGDLTGLPDDIRIFPSFMFDPVWIARDRRKTINDYCNHFDDFFRSRTKVRLADFFPRSHAYHWHNRWGWPLEQGTIIDQLYNEVTQRFGC